MSTDSIPLLMFSGSADANNSISKKCLGIAIGQHQENAKILNINYLKLERIQINHFDDYIGKQYVSREVIGKMQKDKKEQLIFLSIIK